MAKKYGLNSYTVQEGMNAKLGQAGFKELASAGNTGDGNFVAFYVTGKGSSSGTDDQATIAATTHTGDDLTACIFTAGSLVYGPFKKITMSSPTDGDVHVLCYYG
tara:strand:+ start:2743 stop:3057 length:315 start_codon:yes stop_codon:yes gene_type:complete